MFPKPLQVYGGSDANLVGCWQMEEGSGAVLIDATANGNDATITGSPLPG